MTHTSVDATNFTSQNSMDILGFEQDEKMDIYKIVAAVMHLGTMKFKQRGREEQADAEGTKVGISLFFTPISSTQIIVNGI